MFKQASSPGRSFKRPVYIKYPKDPIIVQTPKAYTAALLMFHFATSLAFIPVPTNRLSHNLPKDVRKYAALMSLEILLPEERSARRHDTLPGCEKFSLPVFIYKI